MFVTLAGLFWLLTSAAAQTTVAVSGHAQIPDASAQTNAAMRFQLIGASNCQAKVDGITILSDYHKDFPVNSTTGAFSGVLYPNVASPLSSSINCNGVYGTTKYAVTPLLNGRPNGATGMYVVGPGAFVLESASGTDVSPPTVIGTPGDISFNVETPVVADDGKFQHKLSRGGTIVRLSCDTDIGTVSLNLQVRSESSPNSAGTQLLASPLVCSASNAVTTTFASPIVAANSPLAVSISATSGSPTILRIHVALD